MGGVASLRRMVVEFESNSPCESVLGRERSLLGGREIVARHRNRLSGAGHGVPDDGLVLVRGEKPPDGGLMLRSAQPILELSLGGIRVEGEELERERILGDLLSKFGVGAFESVRKVRRSRSLPRVQVRLDLVASAGRLQPCATSLALYHSRNSASSTLVKQLDDMPLRQSANRSLANHVRVGPRLGEPTHVLEIRRGEPFHPGKLGAQIRGEPGEDLAAPRSRLLSLDERRADHHLR